MTCGGCKKAKEAFLARMKSDPEFAKRHIEAQKRMMQIEQKRKEYIERKIAVDKKTEDNKSVPSNTSVTQSLGKTWRQIRAEKRALRRARRARRAARQARRIARQAGIGFNKPV